MWFDGPNYGLIDRERPRLEPTPPVGWTMERVSDMVKARERRRVYEGRDQAHIVGTAYHEPDKITERLPLPPVERDESDGEAAFTGEKWW